MNTRFISALRPALMGEGAEWIRVLMFQMSMNLAKEKPIQCRSVEKILPSLRTSMLSRETGQGDFGLGAIDSRLLPGRRCFL